MRRGAPVTTVLLVDDHAVFRQGLRALLAGEHDLDVVGEAQDGREAVAMTKRLHPDVVVMDIGMPGLDGIEATRQVVLAAPATRVLVLTVHQDAAYVARARRLGAAGYVLKSASLDDLAAAIRIARSGERFVGPSIPRREPGKFHSTHDQPDGPTPARGLTSREAEVLQGVAESRCNKEIARDLGISVKTVEKHRSRLMATLDIHDVAGLTRYAIESGVVPRSDGGARS